MTDNDGEPRESVGPYRVIRRLGAGGMGEVFLAYDPRLDRRVAIKRVLADAADDPEAAERRARFHREARVAAGLGHPAVAQVFDLLTVGGVDHLVMEHVPGESLRRVLGRRGALPVAEGLEIARAVIRGLAHAHRAGIVHRDLKTENVLLTPEGKAKIVDFGIARRVRRSGDTVTREGTVVGTCRAMSPEQIRGEKVDERSDLFSFGVLLHEIFTGRSPFLAASDAETVKRILEHRPPPVVELAPGLPAALSELIEQLLEKEPWLRPRDAGEVTARLRAVADGTDDGATRGATAVSAPAPRPPRRRLDRRAVAAAATIAFLAAGAGLYFALRPPEPPRYVAVPAVAVTPGDSGDAEGEAGSLAFALRASLLRTLASLEGVSPKSAEEVDAVSGTLAGLTPVDVARAAAADEVVTAAVDCRLRECSVTLGRVRAADGGVTWSDRVSVPLEPLTAARAVAVKVRQGYPDHPPRDPAELAVSAADFAAYLEVARALAGDPGAAALPELGERLSAVRRGSPRFVDAHLLEAEVMVRRFHETRRPELLDRALDLLDAAAALAPEDPRVLFTRLWAETVGGRLDAAGATLRELEPLVPGDLRLLDGRATLLERRGEPDRALELYRTALERRPSWRLLFNHASLAYRLGRIDAARGSLEALLERSPGHHRGLSLLAQLELTHGDPARAAEIYGRLVAAGGGPVELSNLALARLLLGEHDAAAAAFERVVATAPRNPFLVFNLADARALQGREAEAEALYRRSLELLADDPAPGWQGLTVRAQALAHLGRSREAVAAVQEALRRAPGEAQAAFEASLVYALTGDRTAAVVNAERAVELGWQKRWFRLPWFDDLRDDPAFAELAGG